MNSASRFQLQLKNPSVPSPQLAFPGVRDSPWVEVEWMERREHNIVEDPGTGSLSQREHPRMSTALPCLLAQLLGATAFSRIHYPLPELADSSSRASPVPEGIHLGNYYIGKALTPQWSSSSWEAEV